jgi:hypothetical protein
MRFSRFANSARRSVVLIPIALGLSRKARLSQIVARILSHNRADRPNRVHRMDAGWSPEACKVCRAEE